MLPLFLFPRPISLKETVNPQWKRQMGPCHFSDFLILFPAWKRHIPTHLRQWPQNGDRGCQVSLPCQRPHFPFLEFPSVLFFFFFFNHLFSLFTMAYFCLRGPFLHLVRKTYTHLFLNLLQAIHVACSPGSGGMLVHWVVSERSHSRVRLA